MNDYDALGSSNWTGVLDLRKDSGIFVNYYETDGYYNWLTYLRKWYLDGYIYPDAAVTNVEPKELLRSGIIMSIPKTGMPFVFDEENCGEPMAALRTTSVIYGRKFYRYFLDIASDLQGAGGCYAFSESDVYQ